MQSQTPHTERWVGLAGLGQRRQWFVRADIEGAQYDRAAAKSRDHLVQHGYLLHLARQGVPVHEEKLAPQEPDPVSAGRRCPTRVVHARGVAGDLQAPAVAGDRGLRVRRQTKRRGNFDYGI